MYRLHNVLSTIDATATDLGQRTQDPEFLNRQIAQAAVTLFRHRYEKSLFSDVDTAAYDAAVRKGLLARPPCRYELYRVQQGTGQQASSDSAVNYTSEKLSPDEIPDGSEALVLFDIAHNEAAIQALARKLKSGYSDRNIRYDNSYEYSRFINYIFFWSGLSLVCVATKMCRLVCDICWRPSARIISTACRSCTASVCV